jgi:putative toxin-antitoxin system antitoxin component (TIGR02293 family)
MAKIGAARKFVSSVFDRSSDESLPEVVAILRNGLPYATLTMLVEQLSVSQQQLIRILGIPSRTIARRKGSRFTPAESDRLYRVMRTVAQTKATLGDIDKARAWLTRPNRALGGEAPLSLLDTDAGARQVETVLRRIEHGMQS